MVVRQHDRTETVAFEVKLIKLKSILPFISCVTLTKLFNLSGPQILHLLNGYRL